MKEKVKQLYQKYLESEENKRKDLMYYGMYITGHDGMCIPMDSISEEEWKETFKNTQYIKNLKDSPPVDNSLNKSE